MIHNHDINRIKDDGYLVVPLSMAKLASGFGQDPTQCYEMLSFFTGKLETFSNDVIFLYTTGLYLNTADIAYEKRVKLNQQAQQHARELRKLIEVKKDFIPSSIHYLPIDYVILNSDFANYFSLIKKRLLLDAGLREAIAHDSHGRDVTEGQENFILEESIVAHIIRQKLCPLPRTLVKTDAWRLISYPGAALETDKYLHTQNLLPKQSGNPFASGVYDFESRVFVNFEN